MANTYRDTEKEDLEGDHGNFRMNFSRASLRKRRERKRRKEAAEKEEKGKKEKRRRGREREN